MQSYVRDKLIEAIQAQGDECTAEDLLRTFQEQATLMLQTEHVKTMLQRDPYEHLQEIQNSVQRLCQVLSVTAYNKVLTLSGHCRIAATVALAPDAKMHKVGQVRKYVELYFDYDREGTRHAGEQTSVWYSIDVARDDGPREKILWVKVFAAGSVPSGLPARNLDEDNDEDGWEDIDEDNDEKGEKQDDNEKSNDDYDNDDNESTHQAESRLKKARISLPEDKVMEEANGESEDLSDGPLADRFTAGIDPDALSQFLQWMKLENTDEATWFFLLMTFPFYEMEFDLTGFILDAVFGSEDDQHVQEDDMCD